MALCTCFRFGLELSPDDVELMKHVCALLTHRGTLLVGLVLACLLRYSLPSSFSEKKKCHGTR